ncbi:DUF2919 family protein [Alteromonas sp. ASW11-36]|uniref:DUF2919 family protein n=1 Tax=Alteromonas arenosi TaxID=3055817 RepID=A0ABT7SYR2_9ALTE|nr:DUF2919 family protein [Alteromonas sp. ASW11-36]MDM7860669.1 DUF2919 family protein [Alteromonas sp. ASW11-36]
MSKNSGSFSGLEFPLHCYGEDGRVKPPILLYLTAFWLCKALLLTLISVSMRENTTALLTVFYPDVNEWYWHLVPALPGLVVALFVSFNATLRERQVGDWLNWVKPLLLFGLFGQMALQVKTIISLQGQFSWTLSVSLLISIIATLYIWRSRRINAFVRDARDD